VSVASDRARSAVQLDQFSPLPVAEAGDRLGVGDPAAGEQTIGPGGTDPQYDQQQLTHLRRLRAGRRLGDHPRQLDPPSRDLSLRPRACDANLVRLRERSPTAAPATVQGCGGAARNRHRADCLYE
jgi:hypothetical protein